MRLFFLAQFISTCSLTRGTDDDTTLCTSNTCFTLNMDTVNFDSARLNCIDNGGYMVTIKDKTEEAAFGSILSQFVKRHQRSVLKFWIGLKLHKGDCVLPERTLRGFKWVTLSEETPYSNWGEEPISTCTEERCVKISYTLSGQNMLKWVSGGCRGSAFYMCKFHFKGMCKPLVLAGPGQINYTAPFSSKPLQTDMKSLPLGTFADIFCDDHDSEHSVCRSSRNSYRWSNAGPFCKPTSGKLNCAFNNGGCEHLCFEVGDDTHCSCKEGYELGQNQFSCRLKDHCENYACEHRCELGLSGYSCVCPPGFKLSDNRQNCTHIEQCVTDACGDNICINTHGSYKCVCRNGYEMVDGKCRDVDECAESRCPQSCLNSLGSFSCHCDAGFTLSTDGHSCIDTDECVIDRCEYKCANALGSFLCACPKNFHLNGDGLTCAPDPTDARTPALLNRSDIMEVTAEGQKEITDELRTESAHTFAPAFDFVSVAQDAQGNLTTGKSTGKALNTKVLSCVIGTIVPLVLLLSVTVVIVIFRCGGSKKKAEKKTPVQGYYWESPVLEPHLEKLYQSVITDDL